VRHCQEVLALNAASHSPGPVPRERGARA
jgi:hypothetical protein